jgi:ribosomal protein L18E
MGDAVIALITVGAALAVMLIAALLYLKRDRVFKGFMRAAAYSPQSVNTAPSRNESVRVEPEKPGITEKSPEAFPESEESNEDIEQMRVNDLMERAEIIGKVEIDMEKADSLITDALAKDLLKRADAPIRTGGCERAVVNVDTLSEYFYPGERVDINILKRRGIIPDSVSFIKVLARGRVDKPLSVYANEFTPGAVKMIVLSGGEAVKAQTVREKDE